MMIKGSKVNEVKVSVKFDKRTTKTTIKIGDKTFVTGKTGTAMEAVVVYHFRKATGMKLPFSEIMGSVAVTEAKKSKFGINQRFEFVTQLVSMVADSVQPSAIITGEGGLGKTYTVIKTLEAKGYTDISDLAEFQVGVTLNIERMSTIAASPDFLPEYDKGIIADALVFIRTIKDDCKELSLRTLIQVAKCRAANKNWKSLAEYMLTA